MAVFNKQGSKEPSKELTSEEASEIYALFRSHYDFTQMFLEFGVRFVDSQRVWDEIKSLENTIFSLVAEGKTSRGFILNSLESELLSNDLEKLLEDVVAYSMGDPDNPPTWKEFVEEFGPDGGTTPEPKQNPDPLLGAIYDPLLGAI